MLEKIAEMLGASPTQYRYHLNTEKNSRETCASRTAWH